MTDGTEIAGDRPVFIFAASWRTGSTMLQRLLSASDELMIWGEPGFLEQARGLYNRASNYLQKVEWNRKALNEDRLQDHWIPVLSPASARCEVALKNFFDSLYQEESALIGKARWGFKEVRKNALENALFLKKIYPDAKFLVLVRDPFDTFRSLKGKRFHQDLSEKYEAIRTWSQNVEDFHVRAVEENLDFRFVVLEKLVQCNEDNPEYLQELTEFLGIELTKTMIDVLGNKKDSSGNSVELTAEEISEVSDITRQQRAYFEYPVPDSTS